MNPDSAHSPSVHNSWPLAEAQRLRRNSSDAEIFDKALNTFKAKLHANNIPVQTLAKVSSLFYTYRQQMPRRFYRRLLDRRRKVADAWLPMPFHEQWLTGKVAGAVRQYCNSYRATQCLVPLHMNIQARVAWKCMTNPLSVELVSSGMHQNDSYDGHGIDNEPTQRNMTRYTIRTQHLMQRITAAL